MRFELRAVTVSMRGQHIESVGDMLGEGIWIEVEDRRIQLWAVGDDPSDAALICSIPEDFYAKASGLTLGDIVKTIEAQNIIVRRQP